MGLLYDDNEQVAEKHFDSNRDCRHDQFIYYIEGTPERAENDSDFDGRVDVWTFFEQDGKTYARQELDSNIDGVKDRWIHYGDGKPRTLIDDRNADG